MKLIAVAGGSGSGKTTFAEMLLEYFGESRASILYQDSYYIDRSSEFRGDGSLNFDHPNAIDWPLLIRHLQDLRSGKAIAVPAYDFVTHQRKVDTSILQPKEYVIVDGILILVPEEVRVLFDISFFVETSEPVRFQRRLARDVEERGRTPQGVRTQYEATVRPMHDLYVEPSKFHAHHVLSGESITDLKVPEFLK